MAESDPFAAIRKGESSISSNYSTAVLPLLPVTPSLGVTENESNNNGVTSVTPLPHEDEQSGGWREHAAQLEADFGMPTDWAAGVAALRAMDMPHGATEWRWRQIVQDAERFAMRWHTTAIETGWSLEDVFGFDPDDEETTFGLVIEIRGGRPVVLTDGTISVVMSDGTRRWFSPGGAKPGTAPAWAINRNRRLKAKRQAK